MVPPLAGGMVIAALMLAGSGATDDHGDQVSAGGVALGALQCWMTAGAWIEVVLVSAGALCARCVDRVGPYDPGGRSRPTRSGSSIDSKVLAASRLAAGQYSDQPKGLYFVEGLWCP